MYSINLWLVCYICQSVIYVSVNSGYMYMFESMVCDDVPLYFQIEFSSESSSSTPHPDDMLECVVHDCPSIVRKGIQ